MLIFFFFCLQLGFTCLHPPTQILRGGAVRSGGGSEPPLSSRDSRRSPSPGAWRCNGACTVLVPRPPPTKEALAVSQSLFCLRTHACVLFLIQLFKSLFARPNVQLPLSFSKCANTNKVDDDEIIKCLDDIGL